MEEISSIQILVDKLEKIELPNQLISVMGDPALQKLLQLKSTEYTLRRVDYWLNAFFEDQLSKSDAEEEATTNQVLEMLEAIREYTRFTKVCFAYAYTRMITKHKFQVLPQACVDCLQILLETWNGSTGRDVILELLTYLPIQPFHGQYILFSNDLC